MSNSGNSGYGAVGTVNARSRNRPPPKRYIVVANTHLPGNTPITVGALGASAGGSSEGVTIDSHVYGKRYTPGQTVSVLIYAASLNGMGGSRYTFDITMDYLKVQIQMAPKPQYTTTEAITPQSLGITKTYQHAQLRVVNPAGGKFTTAGDAVPVRVEVIPDEWYRGVAPLDGTVKVVKVKPTITLTPPAKAILLGTAVSAAVTAATAPEALPVTLTSPGGAVLNTAGDVQITASFAGNARFDLANPVTVTVKVAAKPTITWPLLADVVVDTVLSDKIRAATINPGGLPIDYVPADGAALGVVGEATLTASFAGNAQAPASDPATAKIKVIKDKPKVDWRPLPVIANTVPGQYTPAAKPVTSLGTQAAVVMKYDPLPTVAVGAAGTMSVKAFFDNTAKYDKNELTTQVKIVADRKAMGREGMLSGDGWTGPQSVPDKQLLKKWNEDDSPTGIKKMAQKVMSDLKDMTADELTAYMDDAINPNGSGAVGTRTDDPPSRTFPNYLWEFPNGLQVRFKPRGDGRPPVTNPPRQMFCVEGKTCNGPTTGPAQVAFKVSADGNPGAYGPGQTHIPPGLGNPQSATYKEYMDGAIGTTHLAVKPKVEQTITWANPPDITVGDTLATTLATVNAQDATALEFFDGTDAPVTAATVLAAGAWQVLKVKGKVTRRYLASATAITVTLNVNKKTRTITWNPAERTVTAGDALGGTLLSAAAPDGVPTYHIAGRSDAVTALTELPAGTYTIAARLAGNDTYQDAAEVSVEVKVERRTQTIEWQPAKKEIVAGLALGDVLNAKVTPSNAKPSYQAVGSTTQTVTALTALPAGIYKITATAGQTDLYLAAAPETVEITVARQPQTVEWRPPRTETVAGTALGGVLNARVTPSDAEPVYQVVGGQGQTVKAETVLAFGTYRIAVSAPQTDLFLAAQPVEASITVARQTQTITWRPAKTELAAGTALGDILNGSVSPGNGPVTYRIEGSAAVTAESVLEPAAYRIVATATETPLLLAPEPVRHEIKILPPAENRE